MVTNIGMTSPLMHSITTASRKDDNILLAFNALSYQQTLKMVKLIVSV